jgi:hypothetical protein
MNLVDRLIVDAQGRAATPCSGLHADPNTDLEMTMLGDSVQPQSLEVFDWLQASTMALDELPDSDLWSRPGYRLTEEWLDNTMKCWKEDNGDKCDDKSAKIYDEVTNCGNVAWSGS